jgi:hypothetical protein
MLRIVACDSRRARDAAQIAFDDRDAGALHRHIGAGAHRDADVRGGQRGGVVDSVAGHRDHAALRAQALHHLLLLRRHDFRLEGVQPRASRPPPARCCGCRPSA